MIQRMARMNETIEKIARENFRRAGYITHPSRERRIPWKFVAPPRSPFGESNTVVDALQRRQRALMRCRRKPFILKTLLDAIRG